MSQANTKTKELQLPDGVTLEIPREFAKYCHGYPIRLLSSANSPGTFTVSWGNNALALAGAHATIEFDLRALLGFVVSQSEEMLGMELCTIRVGLVEADGNKILLPILSANPQSRDQFMSVVNAMSQLRLPVRFFRSAQEMLQGL
jgi:hypothetical protein